MISAGCLGLISGGDRDANRRILEESHKSHIYIYILVMSLLLIFLGTLTQIKCLEFEMQSSIILGFLVAASVRALPVIERETYHNYTAPCSNVFFGGCCPPSAVDSAYGWGKGCLFPVSFIFYFLVHLTSHSLSNVPENLYRYSLTIQPRLQCNPIRDKCRRLWATGACL